MRLSVLAVCALLLSGCSTAMIAPGDPPPARSQPPAERPAVHHARCDAGAANCSAATGRVVYVEAVDSDGDGDAHYVLAGGDVTAPGISVIDVGRDLRPGRLPRVGELVSASGPVYTGSYGQHQIEAVVVNYQRPR
jgi:hypothetical protein